MHAQVTEKSNSNLWQCDVMTSSWFTSATIHRFLVFARLKWRLSKIQILVHPLSLRASKEKSNFRLIQPLNFIEREVQDLWWVNTSGIEPRPHANDAMSSLESCMNDINRLSDKIYQFCYKGNKQKVYKRSISHCIFMARTTTLHFTSHGWQKFTFSRFSKVEVMQKVTKISETTFYHVL